MLLKFIYFCNNTWYGIIKPVAFFQVKYKHIELIIKNNKYYCIIISIFEYIIYNIIMYNHLIKCNIIYSI